jgi:hypothetical protein
MRKTTMIGLGAAGLTILSTFFPMLSGGEMIEQLSSMWGGDNETMRQVGIMMVIIGAFIGLFAFLANKRHLASIGTFLFSAILLLLTIRWSRDVEDSQGLVSYGTGFFIFVLGGLAGIVSAVMGFMKK